MFALTSSFKLYILALVYLAYKLLESVLCREEDLPLVFTATCFSNVAVMGSLDVRLSVRPSVCPSVRLSVTLVIPDHIR